MSNETLKELAHLTEVNNHTEATILIARSYPNMGYYIDIFTAIQKIHKIENHLPYEIFMYRSKKLEEMLELIGDKFGLEEKAKINQFI